MANELKYYGLSGETGLTLTATVINSSGVAAQAGIAMTEVGTTARYVANMPALAADNYSYQVLDGVISKGFAEIFWDGTQEITLEDFRFTVPNVVDANIRYVNDIEVQGAGVPSIDPWRPV